MDRDVQAGRPGHPLHARQAASPRRILGPTRRRSPSGRRPTRSPSSARARPSDPTTNKGLGAGTSPRRSAPEGCCRSAPSAPRRRRRPRCRTTGSRRSRPRRTHALRAARTRDARTGSAKCERCKRHRRSQGPPKVLSNSRETLTGRQDNGSRSRRRRDEHPEIGGHGHNDCFYTFAVRKWVIVFSFVLGLAATTAAVALATGPGDEPAGAARSSRASTSCAASASSAVARSATVLPTIRSSIRAARASHDHTFLGSKTTDAYSTDATLRAAATTCKRRGETAAYWVPTLVSRRLAPARKP